MKMKRFGIDINVGETLHCTLPVGIPYRYSDPDENILHPRVSIEKRRIFKRRIYIRTNNEEETEHYIENIKNAKSLKELKSFLIAIVQSDGYYDSPFGCSLKKQFDIKAINKLLSRVNFQRKKN